MGANCHIRQTVEFDRVGILDLRTRGNGIIRRIPEQCIANIGNRTLGVGLMNIDGTSIKPDFFAHGVHHHGVNDGFNIQQGFFQVQFAAGMHIAATAAGKFSKVIVIIGKTNGKYGSAIFDKSVDSGFGVVDIRIAAIVCFAVRHQQEDLFCVAAGSELVDGARNGGVHIRAAISPYAVDAALYTIQRLGMRRAFETAAERTESDGNIITLVFVFQIFDQRN